MDVTYMANEKNVIKITSKFCWKKWGIKLSKNLGIIFIAGLVSVYADNPYYLIIAPMIPAIENYLKHK